MELCIPDLRALLKSRPIVRCCAFGQLCHPKLIEMVGHMGAFDAIWLDQEHVGLTMPQIEEANRAARSVGLPSFVRLPATDYASVMRPLEAGASGIMASMVRSAAETRSIVNWAKFHPQGGRGVNGTGVDGGYGQYPGADYFKRANERTFIAIQIEHADAVAEVEAIAAVPDVDLLFIGPADLSQSMGLPGQWSHPDVLKAVEKVAKACTAHGVAWGILPRDAAHADQCRNLGCRLFSIGMDVWFFQRGLRSYIEQWPGYFPNS